MASPPAAAAGPGEVQSFERGGWEFEARIQPISHSVEIDEIGSREKLCHVPDMFCGGASLRIRHAASTTVIELDGLDALRCCRWDPWPLASTLPPRSALAARPPAAAEGSNEAGAEVEQGGPLLGIVRCQFAERWKPHSENPDVKEIRVTSDWTCSSPYWGTVYRGTPESKSELDSAAWEATTDELPMELLRQQDEIHWYQEVLYWEDELGDNGLCRFSVRVRVMPTFWFALLICEVRVDNMLLREVSTRLFCRFDSDSVLREWTWKEASYEAMTARGINMADNPQISHQSIGTQLLSEKDVRLRPRQKLQLPKV